MFHGKAMRLAMVWAMLVAMTGLSGCKEITQLVDTLKAGLAGAELDFDGLPSLVDAATKAENTTSSGTWDDDDQESWEMTECTELS